MKRIGKALLWFALNGALAFVLYQGAVNNVQWARNLFVFCTWYLMVMAVVVAMSFAAEKAGYKPANREHARKMVERSVPRFIDVSFDAAVVLVLGAAGWFVTAVVYSVHALFLAVARAIATTILAE